MLDKCMYSKVILAQRYHTLNLVARSLKTKVPNEPRGCLTFNGVKWALTMLNDFLLMRKRIRG
jgi:hypothetical protein